MAQSFFGGGDLLWLVLVTAVPAGFVADAKGSVTLVLPLVMVSSGRKMVPVPRVCADLRLQGL